MLYGFAYPPPDSSVNTVRARPAWPAEAADPPPSPSQLLSSLTQYEIQPSTVAAYFRSQSSFAANLAAGKLTISGDAFAILSAYQAVIGALDARARRARAP